MTALILVSILRVYIYFSACFSHGVFYDMSVFGRLYFSSIQKSFLSTLSR